MTDSYTDQLEREADDLRARLSNLQAQLSHLAPNALDAALTAISRREQTIEALANVVNFLPWDSHQAQTALRSSGQVFSMEERASLDDELQVRISLKVVIEPIDTDPDPGDDGLDDV